MFRGFICLVEGKSEEAVDQFRKAIRLDELVKEQNKEAVSNSFTRLMWGANHGYLFAYPQELKLYNKKQKLAAMLGDYYYVSSQFEKSQKIYQRLLDGKYGRLSRIQTDLPNYVISQWCYPKSLGAGKVEWRSQEPARKSS